MVPDDSLNQDEVQLVQLHWVVNQIWQVLEETSERHTRSDLRRHRQQNMPSLREVVVNRRTRREQAWLDSIPTG